MRETYRQQNLSKLSNNDPINFWINTPMGYYVGNRSFGLPFEWIVGKNMNHKSMILAMILDKMALDLGDSIYSVIRNIQLSQKETDMIKLEVSYNNRTEYKLFKEGVTNG